MSEKNSAVNKDRDKLDAAKARLLDYLIHIGHEPDHRGMCHCVWHQPDEHPSMHFDPDKNLVHCFSCGGGGDLVDVVAAVEGLKPKSSTAIARAIDFAGVAPRGADLKRPSKSKSAADTADYSGYYNKECTAALDDPTIAEYLARRGFRACDRDVLERFNLRADTIKRLLIIPHSEHYYTARPIYPCNKEDRFKHNPRGHVELFNGTVIGAAPVIAVTEGAIDALSLCCLGFPAVGLGGASTHGKLLDAIAAAEHKPNVVIAFDHDDAGQKAAASLEDKLRDRFHVCTTSIVPPAHDCNDAFITNRAELETAIEHAFELLRNATWENTTPFGDTIDPDADNRNPNTIHIDDLSDLGIAATITDTFKDILRYNYTDGGKFMLYQPPVWRRLEKDDELLLLVARLLNSLSPDADAQHRELAKILRKAPRVKRALSMLYTFEDIYIDSEQFDTHNDLLNVANGVLNLDTRQLLPHDGNLLFTRAADAFFDPDAHSDTWERFIETTLPDVDTRAAVQRFLGYCLSGSVAEEKALFVVGSGANGKGTLFKTVMNVMGDFATPFRIDAILAGRRSQDAQAATPEFTKLKHVRLAVAEEVPKGAKLDAAQFKLLTGGDYLPIRRLRQEATLIKNVTHKLILSGNALPQLSDPDDGGLQRRLLVVQFPNQFTDDQRDPLLKFKLSTPAAMSAVLNWLLDGYAQYKEKGLAPSLIMTQTRDKYLADNDLVAAFIEDHCELEQSLSTSRKDLLNHVKKYGEYDLRARPDKDIVALFAKRPDISYVRRKEGCIFLGIGLVQNKPNE